MVPSSGTCPPGPRPATLTEPHGARLPRSPGCDMEATVVAASLGLPGGLAHVTYVTRDVAQERFACAAPAASPFLKLELCASGSGLHCCVAGTVWHPVQVG